jgi:tol-pal system protein YbgF
MTRGNTTEFPMKVALGALRIATLFALVLTWGTGCVTVAEFRKLEREVIDLERSRGGGQGNQRLADLAAEIDTLDQSIARLEGRLEVAEHRADEALEEARSARAAAAALAVVETPGEAPEPPEEGASSAEVQAYQRAHAMWRSGDGAACVDHFRNFLQTYPSSAYADDAAYWMADCYFKQGDFKTAILRYDDVVARFPTSNKAPDALYRQGEALMRLGPNYGNAAGKAFERILKEYPDSARAPEAKRQLELLSSG